MKIKVLFLTEDTNYAMRFYRIITGQHSEQLSVFFYTEAEIFREALRTSFPDIAVIGEEFADCTFDIPSNCGIAYFVTRNNIETLSGERAICKYQMVSHICNELLELYAEKKAQAAITLKGSSKGKRIITFLSPAGGVGTSSVSAGCARRLASQGESVLYLNLKVFGSADRFFNGNGAAGLSRVIYALEMDNSATIAKLESAMKKDPCGVYFYSECQSVVDHLSLDKETMEQLFKELFSINRFQWIVVNVDCVLNECLFAQLERSFATFVISDGTESVNYKLNRFFDALKNIKEMYHQSLNLDRVFVMYNRFSSSSGHKQDFGQFKELGGINRFENATDVELSKLIAINDVFDEIMN